jgi:succinyl-diaminopimelate desuccinylase
MINKKRLIKLTQDLIRIDSQNPPGNEFRIARFVEGYLKPLGLQTRLWESKPRRTNILAQLKGTDSKRSLLITPHLDTVPAGNNWKIKPLSGLIQKNKIYGLGATDCKCNLACAMEAIRSIVEDKKTLSYNLTFAATADEESGSGQGLIPLLKKKILSPDAAVVLDSDDFEIIVTQKGLMHVKLKVRGKRAHGAYPWLGVNAIDVAMDIIRELKDHKASYRKNKHLKAPTINVGTIKGGDKVNVVADWAEFELDFRFLPGTKAQELLNLIRHTLRKVANKFGLPEQYLKLEIEGVQDSYSLGEKHSLAAYLKRAMLKMKIRPHICGSEGATVITFFQQENIPAVATGFGSTGLAHTADEYVEIDNLYKGAKVLEEFLKIYKFDN